MLFGFVSSCLYPWVLATNLDKTKIGVIFYLLAVICSYSSRRRWAVGIFSMASIMSHFSCIVPVILFYLFYSQSFVRSKYSSRLTGFPLNGFTYFGSLPFSWKNVVNNLSRVFVFTERIKIRRIFYLLLLIPIGILCFQALPRIMYYVARNDLAIKDLLQSLYLSFLCSSLLTQSLFISRGPNKRSTLLLVPKEGLKIFFSLYFLFTFLSLVVGLFRFNILILLWLFCASKHQRALF